MNAPPFICFFLSNAKTEYCGQPCLLYKESISLVQNFRPNRKDDEIRVKMDITVDLPAEVAEQAERMGICEFDQCTFDEATRRMTASVTTVFYRKGA